MPLRKPIKFPASAATTTTNLLRISASPTRPAESGTGAVLERGLDTSNRLDFVRERLALVGKTLFLVSFGFYLFLLASMVLVGGAPFVAVVKGPVALGHLAASWTMGLLWLLASRARLSVRSLGALDAIGIVVACGFLRPNPFLSLMTLNDEGQILQVLLALTVTVMIRAILVPSRPGRTMVLSAPSTRSSGASWGPRWPPLLPGSPTDFAGRSPKPMSWVSTSWRRRSVAAGWARSGGRATGC